MKQPVQPPIARVFISCSLRQEDRKFVEWIEAVLRAYRFEPFGTVGLFSASPSNPAVLMRENIPKADFVVIAATPRYFQTDVHTNQRSSGMSEMIHVESGMAYALDKPVVAFVRDGARVNFLQYITQCIPIDKIARKELPRILNSMFNKVYQIILQKRSTETKVNIGKGAITTLAVVGAVTIINALFADDDVPRRSSKKRSTAKKMTTTRKGSTTKVANSPRKRSNR